MKRPGDKIAHYQLIRFLGDNAQTQTWLAQQGQEQVVMKLFSLTDSPNWRAYELFEREIKALQNLSIAGVPRFITYLQQPQALVIEFIAGETLQHWIQRHGRCSLEQWEHIAGQILEVLTHLHAHDPPMIHRQIHPEHLIWNGKRAFLIGFGHVRHVLPHQENTVMGTYGYMAPEQYKGNAWPTSDLYGLGCSLIYLASARSPSEMLNENLELDFREHVHLPAQKLNWLQRMVASDPAQRFASAQEALRALTQKSELPIQHWSALTQSLPEYMPVQVNDERINIKLSVQKIHSPAALAILMLTAMILALFYPLFWSVVVYGALMLLGRMLRFFYIPRQIQLTPERICLEVGFQQLTFPLEQLMAVTPKRIKFVRQKEYGCLELNFSKKRWLTPRYSVRDLHRLRALILAWGGCYLQESHPLIDREAE